MQHRIKSGTRKIRTEDRLFSQADRIVLAPCPFCGGVPAVRPVPSGTPGALMISCGNSSCPARPLVLGYSLPGAALVWNTRHTAWIPIDQALPQPRARVLVVRQSGVVDLARLVGSQWINDAGVQLAAPTAWQPLPPVPGAAPVEIESAASPRQLPTAMAA